MKVKIRLTPSQRQAIVFAFRDFANSAGNSNHVDFANTIINGKRQNSDALYNFVTGRVGNLPLGFTKNSVENLVRRAVGKGSTTDGTSPELIGYFNNWVPTPASPLKRAVNLADIARRSTYEDVQQQIQVAAQSGVQATSVAKHTAAGVQAKTITRTKRVAKTPIVKPAPTTTLEILQHALTSTQFTATELLTKKFTVVEFLDRIGVKVTK